MFLRMVYDERLAQACYVMGCQRTGEAIVIDPQRDVDRYLALAAREGLRVTAVAETHIHADYLSGVRELAERTGARVYVSGEGGPDWQYEWLDKKVGGGSYDHRALRHDDTFRVGNIEFRVIYTPGHTPEHICFLVTDRGGGATEPMGVVTGDFVFVGDMGRPDLLETAAGMVGVKDASARDLFRSTRRFLDLPDFLQVWPAHGAGSACGKALGAVPQTTVGYERRFNPSLRAATSESAFADYILAGQPEPPMYFARMKQQNKAGPRVLGGLPRPARLTRAQFATLDGREVAIVDTRPWKLFKAGHVPGSLFAPIDAMFPMVVGSFIQEPEQIYLVVESSRLDEVVRDLIRIGLDNIAGWLDSMEFDTAGGGGGSLTTSAEVGVEEAQRLMESERAFVLDVRRATEHAEGHIPGSLNAAYTRLPARLAEVPKDRHILVHCRSGARSARACAYLSRAGYRVTNLAGGFLAWEQAHQPAPAR